MNKEMNPALADAIQNFTLPRYNSLPNMGLYLEQTTKYINECLKPLGCVSVTGSMIRNYVKMGLVDSPVKKLYYAEQIAHLIVVTVLKTVLPLSHIGCLFERQRQTYTNQVAYDYFCAEMENILYFRFGITGEVKDVGVTSSQEKELLRSAVIAVSHIIYLNAWFSAQEEKRNSDL